MNSEITVAQASQQIKELETLVATRPTTEVIGNLGAMYFTMGDPERALPFVMTAWQYDRESVELGINAAMVLKDIDKHQESAKIAEETYFKHPDNFFIRLAYAEALLKAGLWRNAWPIYDNARPTQQGAAKILGLPLSVKEWQNQIIKPGETLLVINEGGTGDRFTYPRWLNKLTELGIDWRFYPFEELFPFFERIFPRNRLVKDGDDGSVLLTDYWTTSFALPARLNATPTTIPPPLPFMASQEALNRIKISRKKPSLNKFMDANESQNVPVIGICWSAAELFQGGRKVRSLTEGQMMRLVTSCAHKINFVNLQYGVKAPYPIINLPISNWEDTAAILTQIDGLITVDTGVMHLGGAMQKPMAVLLSGNSCWKFLKNGKKCYWFDSATLYRNRGFGFENAIDSLIEDIRNGIWPK